MTKAEELLERMRSNPRDWTIGDLKVLARRSGIEWRQPGTSHVTFSHPGHPPVTIPAHKPVKPIYVIRFLAMLDSLETKDDL